jgi:hypothetical protein
MKRLLMTTLVGVCIAAVPVVALPALPAHAKALPVHAKGVDFVCTGTAEFFFSPGLTNTPQTVEVIYSSILTCPLAPLRVSQGRASAIFTIPEASCPALATVPTTVKYAWYPLASSSTVDYFTSFNLPDPAVVVQTGTVTAGMAAGDRAVSTIKLLSVNLGACDTPTGLTYLSGPEELTFVS